MPTTATATSGLPRVGGVVVGFGLGAHGRLRIWLRAFVGARLLVPVALVVLALGRLV
jgi:hypothetical protein